MSHASFSGIARCAAVALLLASAACNTAAPEPPVETPPENPAPPENPPAPPPPPPPPAFEVLDDAGNVVAPGTTLSTDHLTFLTVTRSEGQFRALFGPRPGVAETAQLVVSSQPPFLFLTRGWIYLDGVKPIVRARRIMATALSTQFLAQVDVEANVDRVFLRTVSGDEQLLVEKLTSAAVPEDSAILTTSAGDRFVAGSLSERKLSAAMAIPDVGDPVGDFYRAALDAAHQVGFP